MSEVTHALLGASSAHRWLNCPGSAPLLTADMPDTTSLYAEEGTLAHSVCESYARYCLLDIGYAVVSCSTDNHSQASDEMLDCAGLYVETIVEIAKPLHNPYIALEQRVDYSKWVPEGFGTADCIIIGDGTLTVIDYKHGKGVQVEAEGNPQLMLYVPWAHWSATGPSTISALCAGASCSPGTAGSPSRIPCPLAPSFPGQTLPFAPPPRWP